MKKITIFSLHLSYGGIEKCVCNLANLLCNDYDVEIISTYKIGECAFKLNDKVKVNYLIDKYTPNRDEWKVALKKFKPIKLIKETYKAIRCLILRRSMTTRAIKNCNSDIMISTRVLFNGWLGKYGRRKAYKIGWEHNHHHNDMEYAKNVCYSCSGLDSLVLVSKSLRDFYSRKMKDYGLKCRCIFIPNMLDEIPKEVSNLKEKRIISIGRLSKEKGFLDLIDVFKDFHKLYPDYHLDIVGDGSLRNKIVDKIYLENLTDSITMHGYLKKEEINKLLKKSSLYVMTSYTESFGLVLLEAMAYGVPCISYTSAEGANDLIENDFNGYLIEDRDSSKMIEAMKKIINDYDLRCRLGKNGREFCLKYDKESNKKEWIKLLSKRG